jgi:calcineurin-like phosphoesterase family protein
MTNVIKKLDKISIVLSLTAVLFLSVYAIAFTASNASATTELIAVGDIGCRSASLSNLKNIANSAAKEKVLGVGDIVYNCSPSSIQKNWDAIKQEKHSVLGNHDVEKSSSKAFMAKNFGLGPSGWFSWKINDIAIIGINDYRPFNEGSVQHTYLEQKTTQFCGRDDSTLSPINWVIYATHEPIQTPSVGGGHGPNKALRSVLESLAEKCGDNVLILEGHNHITAFGNVQGNNHALCGGGGFGGDDTGDSAGFEFQTKKFGYCQFSFGEDNIEAKLIGTDGKVIGTHRFTAGGSIAGSPTSSTFSEQQQEGPDRTGSTTNVLPSSNFEGQEQQ